MKRRLHKSFGLIAISVIIISFNSTQLQAQAGTLDMSFGDSGIVHSKNKITFTSLAVQSNNKIVISGHLYNGNGYAYITTSRFMPNGDVDSAYGDNGCTLTNF